VKNKFTTGPLRNCDKQIGRIRPGRNPISFLPTRTAFARLVAKVSKEMLGRPCLALFDDDQDNIRRGPIIKRRVLGTCEVQPKSPALLELASSTVWRSFEVQLGTGVSESSQLRHTRVRLRSATSRQDYRVSASCSSDSTLNFVRSCIREFVRS
jgi:hypothetical protein